MLILQNTLKFLNWLFFFIIGDLLIRAILTFVLSSEFKQGHEFRELLILRSIEIAILLILTRHGLVSIFGKLGKLKKEILISVFIYFGLVISFLGLEKLFSSFGIPLFKDYLMKLDSNKVDLELFFIAVIIGPFIEEVCFRGILWNALSHNIRKIYLKLSLMLLCASPFVLLHLNLNATFSSQIPMIVMWSTCAFCTLFLLEWRKSILCGLALHSCANAVIYFGAHFVT
jgi:membrane protease YdiL (CAAX protease family)